MAKEIHGEEAKAYDTMSPSEAKGGEPSEDEMLEKPEVGARPPAGKLRGYTQTYLVRKAREGAAQPAGSEEKGLDDECEHEVLFRCGNWCYTGHVVLNKQIGLKDVPVAIPLLQRQQSRLHYYCNASSIPKQSTFHSPVHYTYEVSDFAAAALSSDAITEELERWSEVYEWMEDRPHETFFELQTDSPSYMEDVALVASKTYARGLIFISIFFEGTFYIAVFDGEGDQPLLDVRFPDVSHHGQGVQLLSAHEGTPPWFVNFSLWHSMPSSVKLTPPPTRNLTSGNYVQSYLVMRPRAENGGFAVTSAYREVLFRFGNWCYGGSVQLTPCINLADIPLVIPALRIQQSRLEFVYSADQIPATSPFLKPMEYMMHNCSVMEREIESAEDVLSKLVERLSAMGLGQSISSWLEGDPTHSFFEFQVHGGDEEMKTLHGVELIANKTYFASGIVLITIYFQGTFYAIISDGSREQPLLDSKFPNVSSKGRGYQIRAYNEGIPDWPSLRKVSVWQTTAAMQAALAEVASSQQDVVDEARAAGGHDAARAVVTEQEHNAKAEVEEVRRIEEEEVEQAAAKQEQAAAPLSEKSTVPATSKPVPGAKAEAKSDPQPFGSVDPLSAAAQSKNPSDKQSLGAFHRLAPLGGMEGKLDELRTQMRASGPAPWDNKGRPLGRGDSLNSTGEFKP